MCVRHIEITTLEMVDVCTLNIYVAVSNWSTEQPNNCRGVAYCRQGKGHALLSYFSL